MQRPFIASAIILALLSSSVPLTTMANAQSVQTVTPYYPNDNQKLPTQSQILQTSLSGPVYLNSYWTDQGSSSSSTSTTSGSSSSSSASSSGVLLRKQVGPGDGAATLAVVLLDRGLSDITGITGHLTLPSGFTPNGARSGSNIADASYNSLVSAGNTFTLYFDINVTNRTNVGAYVSSLDVQYSQVLSTGSDFHSKLDIPFQLTGRVILDTLTITHNLTPGVANNVQFQIINRGSAPATGVVASITGISTSGASNSGSGVTVSTSGSDVRVTNFGARTFNVGTVPSNSNTSLTASLFPGNNAGSSTTTVSLQITYNDPYGNTQTLNPNISLFVLPSSPSLISVLGGTNGNASDNRVVAGKVADFTLLVSNRGSSPISNAVVTLNSGSTSLQILGDTKWTIDSINGQSSIQLPTRIYASPSLIGTPVNFSVTIDYLTNGQSKTEQYTIGTYVDGDINLSTYGLALTYVGGGSTARTGATGVGSIGGTPTLTGNILNKGNTVALFTTVQLEQVQYLNGSSVGRFRQAGQQGLNTNQGGFQGQFGGSQGGQFGQGQQGAAVGANSNQTGTGRAGLRGSQSAQPQYLGDVTADSPVPFSITLDSMRNATAAPLRVTLLITYSDGLRNPHEVTVTQVVFPQSNSLGNFGTRSAGPFAFLGPLSDYGIPIIIAIIAAIALAVAVVIVRKRRANARKAANQRIGSQDNIEDILEEPTAEKGSQNRSKDSRLK